MHGKLRLLFLVRNVVLLVTSLTFACNQNASPAASKDEYLAACLVAGSCLGFGVEACFAQLPPDARPFDAARYKCLAAAGSDCAKAGKCLGIDNLNPNAVCNPPSVTCSGDKLSFCDGTLSGLVDCSQATYPNYQCVRDHCAAGSCTVGDQGICVGTRLKACDGAVQYDHDCADDGLTCENNGSFSSCVGTGRACSLERDAPRCDGATLVVCVGGYESRVDCGKEVTGRTCQSTGTSAFCGFGSTCDPNANGESCSGSTLSYCAAGMRQTVDCTQKGFRGGCLGHSCRP